MAPAVADIHSVIRARRWAALVGVGLSCCRGAGDAAPSAPLAPALVTPPDVSSGPRRIVVLDMARSVDRCSFGHRGLLIDFGDPSVDVAPESRSAKHGPNEVIEIEGATWLRIHSHAIVTTFYWPAVASEDAGEGTYLEARARGLAAHAMSVAIDGRLVARWPLEKHAAGVLVTRAPLPVALTPGPHELSVRLAGGSPASDEPLVDLDWIHVGIGDSTEPYAAPTREDALVDAAPGGQSTVALALRAPGFVRCSGWIPADATFEALLATEGGGDADVEARIVRDRRAPVVLGTAHVTGGGPWMPWSVPVAGLDGEGALASLELVVRRASRGTRALFGAPQVVQAAAPLNEASSVARGVVLVILGSTSATALAPWGGPRPATELAKLAASGTIFLANRAPTSVASGVVAAILTGLPPSVLGLDGATDRLDGAFTLLSEACRQGGIVTAMFTANPTTGSAFGFDRGWDTFELHDPLEDAPATRVFDAARDWIEAHKSDRFFVTIDARGGHPPWDATADDLKTMAPPGYFGFIDPHRAAETLAKVKRHPTRLKEDDRVRAWALHDRALDEHDAALGTVLAELQATGRDRDTVVVVTGDVAANEGAPVPFTDPDGLEEPVLATPLVVRWPSRPALASRRVDAATSSVDVARTIVDAFGLTPPATFQGTDLAMLALGDVAPPQRPIVATRDGRFSVRWGTYVLTGSSDAVSRMCDLSLDPACIADVRGTSPLALESIRRFVPTPVVLRAPSPQPTTLDARTSAALTRWGRVTDDAKR